MAHADYDCCARCDAKMFYNAAGDARTKEQVCARCVLGLRDLTGEDVITGADLAALVGRLPPGEVERLGIEPCYYANPVDDAVRRARAHSESDA